MSELENYRLAIAAARHDRNSPLFQAPWQARIFALTVEAVKTGHFPWTDFQARLVSALGRNAAAGLSESVDRTERQYFDAWLAAAEETLLALGLIRAGEVDRQIETLRAEVDRIRSAQSVAFIHK